MSKLTQEDIIKKCVAKHGNKYDYSKVNFINHKTKIEIVCPKHGSFWQKAVGHYSAGYGCRSCRPHALKTTSEFVEESKGVHGDRYDYSLTEYKHSTINVTLVCKIHGSFNQNPQVHLRGGGCPKCANENSNRGKHPKSLENIHSYYTSDDPKESSIYLMNIDGKYLKIGISNNPKQRACYIRYKSGMDCKIIFEVYGESVLVYGIEKGILADTSLPRPEIKEKFTGYTECFNLDIADKLIKRITKEIEYGYSEVY